MTTTDTPRTDAAIELYGDRPFMVSAVPVEFAEGLERELAASKAEVKKLRDAFSRLTDEIECSPKCSSHQADHCDCGRLERAYAISSSIAQNPTK